MKILILICEECARIFNPYTYPGKRCAYCNGKLILVFIDPSDNDDTNIPFQEDIS